MKKVGSSSFFSWKAGRFQILLVVFALAGTPFIAAQANVTTASADAAQSGSVSVPDQIRELKQEIADLRSQLAVLKAGMGTASEASVSQLSAASNALKAEAASAALPAAMSTKPDPLAGVSSVLGGASFTGLVDGYYSFNLNHPSTGTSALSNTTGQYSSLRLFDARNGQFALSLIELGLVKNPSPDSRLGYKAIFGFGDAMQQVNVVSGADPSFLQYVKEAYVSLLVPAGKGLQVDMGKFVTPHGAEVIESNANWNYSRSLLFNYAIPFYHYGMRAQYTFSPTVSLTGYLVNGWNDVVHDSSNGFTNSGKTGGLTLALVPGKKLTVTQNWMGGPGATQSDGDHWRNLVDTVVAYNVNSRLSLQMNSDYGRVEATNTSPLKPVDWWGAAGYVRYQLNPLYALAGRYEYYNDPNGYTTGIADAHGVGPHIHEVTGTIEHRLAAHLISRFEYRHDESNQSFFPKGKAGTPPVTGQSTIAAGMIFVFEPSETK
jgi:Putative beta-barrel porin-2, OmpL-like. bbp2